MTGKKTSTKTRLTPTVASPDVPHAGQLFRFPKPTKRRGRPPKAAGTPSTDDFDIVCAAIRGIPKGKRLAKAKAEARRIVGGDKRTNRAELALYGRVLDAINHAEGKDWHSVGFYAKDDQCGPPKRTVERSFRGLTRNGHLLRRRIPGAKGGWNISETTSPTLARAGNIVARAPIDVDTDENIPPPADEKCTGCRPLNTWGPDHYVGLTSKVNLKENLKDKSKRADAREDDFDKSILTDGAGPTVTAEPQPTAPRFDVALPLADRIAVDGADRAFLEGLGKGWPLPTLRDQFTAWLAGSQGKTPGDAQKAFTGWLVTTQAKRIAATPGALAALRGDPEGQVAAVEAQGRREGWEFDRAAAELAKRWTAEDRADAPLRAPFAPIPINERLQQLRLARCNALILRRLGQRGGA